MGEKDRILEQLSLFSLLAASSSNPPVCVQQEVISTDMGSHHVHTLRLKIQNVSPVKMTHGWSMNITLQSQIETTHSEAITNSSSLPSLSSKQFQRVDVTFTDEMLQRLPLDMTVILAFTFPTDDGGCKSVSVVVLRDCLDIVNFLVPEEEGINMEPAGEVSLEQVSIACVRCFI